MASSNDKFSKEDISLARQFDTIMGKIASKSSVMSRNIAENATIYNSIKQILADIDVEMRDFRSEALKFSSTQKTILNQMQFVEALNRKHDTQLTERNALQAQMLNIDESLLANQIDISQEAAKLIELSRNNFKELSATQSLLADINNIEESITNMVDKRVVHTVDEVLKQKELYTLLKDKTKDLHKQYLENKEDAVLRDRYLDSLKEQKTLRRDIAKIQDSIKSDAELKTQFNLLSSLKSTNKERRAQLSLMMDQESRNKSIQEKQDAINTIFGAQLSSVKNIGHELAHIAHSPIAAILAVANGIHEVFGEWVEGISEARTELGLSYAQSVEFAAATTHYTKSYLLFGNKTTKMLSHMTEHLGHMPHFTSAAVEEMTKFSAVNKIAVGEAATLAANLYEIPGMSEQMTISALKYTQALGDANHIPLGELTKTISANTEDFALFAGKGAKNVLQAAAFAKKLGVEFGTLTNVAKSLLDFESSITHQMETSALLGREVNFDKARQLALANDIKGMGKEVIRQLGSESEWTRLNRFQREAIADSLGLTALETEKIIKNQKYGAEGLDDQAKASAKLNNLLMIGARIFSSTTFEIGMAGAGLVMLIARYKKLKDFGSSVIGDFKDGFKTLGKDIGHILSTPFRLIKQGLSSIKLPSVGKFKWPSFPTFKWPSIPTFKWPTVKSFKWPNLPAFKWPTIPAFKWPAISKFKWPSIPTFTWPKIPSINWSEKLRMDQFRKLLSGIKLPTFDIKPINWSKVFLVEKANQLITFLKVQTSALFRSFKRENVEAAASTKPVIAGLSSMKVKLLELIATSKLKASFDKLFPAKKAVNIESKIDIPDMKDAQATGERIKGFSGKINTTELIKGAAALTILAGGLFIASKAFTQFGQVQWDSIGKGLVAITGLTLLSSLLQKSSRNMIIGSLGIATLGAALIPFGYSMKMFGDVDWKSIGVATTGLIAFSAAALTLGTIMSSGAGAIVFGAGLLAIAGLGGAMTIFGNGLSVTADGLQSLSSNLKPLASDLTTLTSQVPQLFLLGAGLTAVAGGLTALGTAGVIALPGIAALTLLSKLATIATDNDPINRITSEKSQQSQSSTNTQKDSEMDISILADKLDQMIGLLKQPGVVNLDGRKVGEALRLAMPQSSGR